MTVLGGVGSDWTSKEIVTVKEVGWHRISLCHPSNYISFQGYCSLLMPVACQNSRQRELNNFCTIHSLPYSWGSHIKNEAPYSRFHLSYKGYKNSSMYKLDQWRMISNYFCQLSGLKCWIHTRIIQTNNRFFKFNFAYKIFLKPNTTFVTFSI